MAPFLFKVMVGSIAAIAGAVAIFRAYTQSNFNPIFIFGGICLAAILMPKFINGVFGVSGMMIP